LLRYAGLLALFAVVYLLLLRPVKTQVLHILGHSGTALPSGAGTTAAALPPALAGNIPDSTSGLPAVTEAVALKKELLARVKDDPQAAGRVVETWMREV
ncbi:MAG TPA: hypothetical protein VKF79_06670, partial [Candidatus Acidoferrum sp.]|nr:hypothetical protein [Candidatus Acidoferrum sp.]